MASLIGIAGWVHIFSVVLPLFLAHILWVLFLGLFIEISENIDYFFLKRMIFFSKSLYFLKAYLQPIICSQD